MAHVEKRGPGRWRARYRLPNGQERSKTFDRKVDAERFVTTMQADLLRGSYVDPHDRTTVGEYARRWAARRPHRPATARRVALTIEKHIVGTSLGSQRLASVLPSDVQAWVIDRAKVLAPSTLRVTVGLLRSVFASAVLDRLVASSPVVRLALPAGRREKVLPLDVEQVRLLAGTVPPRYRAMVVAQAGLGLRVGELLALRACDVDFLRRTARVEHQIGELSRQREEPKTQSSRRTVPLPQVVADALAQHLSQWPAPASGLIFSTTDGLPYTHNHYGSGVFRGAVRRAGLPSTTTTHDLRHHFASVLLAAGESVVAVAEWLGHDDASLVLSTYGHLMPNSEERARKAIDEAWSQGSRGLDAASDAG